jgi:hypothetical protein
MSYFISTLAIVAATACISAFMLAARRHRVRDRRVRARLARRRRALG